VLSIVSFFDALIGDTRIKEKLDREEKKKKKRKQVKISGKKRKKLIDPHSSCNTLSIHQICG